MDVNKSCIIWKSDWNCWHGAKKSIHVALGRFKPPTLRLSVGMLHKIRHREIANVLGFIPDLYMPIGANVGSGQYLIRANAKISLSWQASPIFWLSIALHYKPAWLNIPPLLPKYEVDWRSCIDIAGIFQFLLLCHRLVGWIISKIKYYISHSCFEYVQTWGLFVLFFLFVMMSSWPWLRT